MKLVKNNYLKSLACLFLFSICSFAGQGTSRVSKEFLVLNDLDQLDRLKKAPQETLDHDLAGGMKVILGLDLPKTEFLFLFDAKKGRLRKVKSLEIASYNNLDARFIRYLPKTLEELMFERILEGNKLTDEQAVYLERLKSLRVLKLAGHSLGDQGLETVGQMAYLEKLDLSDNLARYKRAPSRSLGLEKSPGWEHINLAGDYLWCTNTQIGSGKFRPLRALIFN